MSALFLCTVSEGGGFFFLFSELQTLLTARHVWPCALLFFFLSCSRLACLWRLILVFHVFLFSFFPLLPLGSELPSLLLSFLLLPGGMWLSRTADWQYEGKNYVLFSTSVNCVLRHAASLLTSANPAEMVGGGVNVCRCCCWVQKWALASPHCHVSPPLPHPLPLFSFFFYYISFQLWFLCLPPQCGETNRVNKLSIRSTNLTLNLRLCSYRCCPRSVSKPCCLRLYITFFFFYLTYFFWPPFYLSPSLIQLHHYYFLHCAVASHTTTLKSFWILTLIKWNHPHASQVFLQRT